MINNKSFERSKNPTRANGLITNELEVRSEAEEAEIKYSSHIFREIMRKSNLAGSAQELRDFLKRRWDLIKSTNSSYCCSPETPFNITCIQLAKSIAPLLQVSANQLLMPTVEVLTNEITGTDFSQVKISEFVLSDDNKRFIEVAACLDCARDDGILRHTSLFNGQTKELSQEEANRVIHHSHYSVLYYMAILPVVKCRSKSASIGSLVKNLIDALRGGGASRDGEEYDSGAQANEGIVTFANELEKFSDDTKTLLFNSRSIRENKSFRQIWGILTRDKNVNYAETRFCVEINAGQLDNVLLENPALFNINCKGERVADIRSLERTLGTNQELYDRSRVREGYKICPTYSSMHYRLRLWTDATLEPASIYINVKATVTEFIIVDYFGKQTKFAISQNTPENLRQDCRYILLQHDSILRQLSPQCTYNYDEQLLCNSVVTMGLKQAIELYSLKRIASFLKHYLNLVKVLNHLENTQRMAFLREYIQVFRATYSPTDWLSGEEQANVLKTIPENHRLQVARHFISVIKNCFRSGQDFSVFLSAIPEGQRLDYIKAIEDEENSKSLFTIIHPIKNLLKITGNGSELGLIFNLIPQASWSELVRKLIGIDDFGRVLLGESNFAKIILSVKDTKRNEFIGFLSEIFKNDLITNKIFNSFDIHFIEVLKNIPENNRFPLLGLFLKQVQELVFKFGVSSLLRLLPNPHDQVKLLMMVTKPVVLSSLKSSSDLAKLVNALVKENYIEVFEWLGSKYIKNFLSNTKVLTDFILRCNDNYYIIEILHWLKIFDNLLLADDKVLIVSILNLFKQTEKINFLRLCKVILTDFRKLPGCSSVTDLCAFVGTFGLSASESFVYLTEILGPDASDNLIRNPEDLFILLENIPIENGVAYLDFLKEDRLHKLTHSTDQILKLITRYYRNDTRDQARQFLGYLLRKYLIKNHAALIDVLLSLPPDDKMLIINIIGNNAIRDLISQPSELFILLQLLQETARINLLNSLNVARPLCDSVFANLSINHLEELFSTLSVAEIITVKDTLLKDKIKSLLSTEIGFAEFQGMVDQHRSLSHIQRMELIIAFVSLVDPNILFTRLLNTVTKLAEFKCYGSLFLLTPITVPFVASLIKSREDLVLFRNRFSAIPAEMRNEILGRVNYDEYVLELMNERGMIADLQRVLTDELLAFVKKNTPILTVFFQKSPYIEFAKGLIDFIKAKKSCSQILREIDNHFLIAINDPKKDSYHATLNTLKNLVREQVLRMLLLFWDDPTVNNRIQSNISTL